MEMPGIWEDDVLSCPSYLSIKYTPWRHPCAVRTAASAAACLPSVILSAPRATAPVAWRGGLHRPPPSRAAASIPPSLSHWPREWVPSWTLPAPEAACPFVCPSILASREGEDYLAGQVCTQGRRGSVSDTPPRGTGQEAGGRRGKDL